MKVAVCIYSNDFVTLAEGEAYGGSIAGLKLLTLVALLGLNGYPFNVVLRLHGVIDRADIYNYLVAFYLPNGNVLLRGCFNGTGDDFGHILTAALYGYSAILNNSHNVAAVLTNIKFLFHYIFLQLCFVGVAFDVVLSISQVYTFLCDCVTFFEKLMLI